MNEKASASTTAHLSENELVLYYYAEDPFASSGSARAQADTHLAQCMQCRTNLASLEHVLATVDALPVPERDAAYGAAVWAAISPRLARTSKLAHILPLPSWFAGAWPMRSAVAAAAAALVIAAFLLGRYSQPSRRPVPQIQQADNTVSTSFQPVRERILLVAVGDHLERSQMVLLELTNARPQRTVDISSEQHLARDLIDSNRLYRQTALRDGDASLASVLEELECSLLEIAHSPSRISSPQFERLRRRIEAQGILFKVRVVDTQLENKIRTQTPAPAAPANHS